MREDFSHIKPVVQSGGGTVAVAGQAWGDPLGGVDVVNAGSGNIQPAGLYSTAPHVPDKKLSHCTGKDGTCTNTKRLRASGLCSGCDMQRRKRERLAD